MKASADPQATLSWLSKGKAWAVVLEALGNGTGVTHEDLDAIPRKNDSAGRASARHDIEYARALLVAAGLLPLRSEFSLWFQAWADQALQELSSSSNRWLARRFCQEQLVPVIVSQEGRGRATRGTVRWAQARLRATIAFVEWLGLRGGASSLNRAALDEWLSGPTPRYNVRDFVRWAIRERLVDLPLSAMPSRTVREVGGSVDYDDRAAVARRLLHDDGVSAADRVAGLLVVLYGQHLSRIVRLTALDISREPVRIRLGQDRLVVPEPMDSCVMTLLGEQEVTKAGPRRWLFPGTRPGQHLSEESLGRRLDKYGIRARTMRNAALFHLASTIQPHTLYRLLGLHPNTAVAWSQVAGSVYAAYWSDLIEGDLTVSTEEVEDVDEATLEEVLSDLDLNASASDNDGWSPSMG